MGERSADVTKAGAWKLLGVQLDTGWVVIKALGWDPATGETSLYGGTGGNFSVAYVVERDGRQAFMKAFDFTRAFNSPNTMDELQDLIQAHAFEAKILDICAAARLDRIVVAIESGEVRVGENLQDRAPYLIFELAEGDVRKKLRSVGEVIKVSWWLKALHHASIGLMQLHGNRIAHQDVKPSNVLSFDANKGFKLADLGRSVNETFTGPFDDMVFSGDPNYRPPEIIYATPIADPTRRRLANDLYMLGSLIFFFVKGQGATVQLFLRLEKSLWPPGVMGPWTGTYPDILPVLQAKFSDMLAELKDDLPDLIAEGLVKAASELCNPDPALRGHPLDRAAAAPFSLTRYVSLFDRLTKLAEIAAKVAQK